MKKLSLLLALVFLFSVLPAAEASAYPGSAFYFGGQEITAGSTSVEVRGKSNSYIYISDPEMKNLVRYCPDLEKLTLDYCYMEDASYQRIGKLGGLTSLRLMSTKGNPLDDLSFVENLTELTNLDLCYNAIDDLEPLSGLSKLTSLNLGGNRVDGDDLYAIADLPKLKKLYLYSNQIRSISALASLTSLQLLNVQKNSGLKSFSVTKHMPSLSTLMIQYTGCNSLGFTVNVPYLAELNIAGCPLDYDEYMLLNDCDRLATVTIGTDDEVSVKELYDMLRGYVKVTDGKTTLPKSGKPKARPYTPKPTKKATATPKPTKKATATPKATKKATAAPKVTAAPLVYDDGFAIHKNGRKVTSVRSLREGDIVTFGSYSQDGTRDKTSLEWMVLDIEDSEVLLITVKAIAAMPYHTALADVTWEECSLRVWLNSSFYRSAFTLDDRDYIRSHYVETEKNPDYKKSDPGEACFDKVFILDRQEIQEYFPAKKDRWTEATVNAVNAGARVNTAGYCFWWTRTPGSSNHNNCVVDNDGSFYSGTHVDVTTEGKMGCVRPCVYISFALNS